jgi:chromate reductase
MLNQVHLIGISGSLRKGSLNTMLLNSAVELLPPGITMEILSIDNIPLYNADLDLPLAKQRPPEVEYFRNKIAEADGLLIASPEFSYSIPGGLKNAFDWAARGEDAPLLQKPVAIIGATTGEWGTVRMQTAFHTVFLFLDMKPIYKPEVLVARADKKFDKNGKLTDETTKELLLEKIHGLKEMILLQTQFSNAL